jgi:hypothetical protein
MQFEIFARQIDSVARVKNRIVHMCGRRANRINWTTLFILVVSVTSSVALTYSLITPTRVQVRIPVYNARFDCMIDWGYDACEPRGRAKALDVPAGPLPLELPQRDRTEESWVGPGILDNRHALLPTGCIVNRDTTRIRAARFEDGIAQVVPRLQPVDFRFLRFGSRYRGPADSRSVESAGKTCIQ